MDLLFEAGIAGYYRVKYNDVVNFLGGLEPSTENVFCCSCNIWLATFQSRVLDVMFQTRTRITMLLQAGSNRVSYHDVTTG